jgi:hypothetical protein
MGNCLKVCGDGGRDGAIDNSDKQKNGDVRKDRKKPSGRDKKQLVSPLVVRTTTRTIHDGLLEEQTANVYDKYQEIEVLGNGSMGHVSRVRVKEGASFESESRPLSDVNVNKEFISRKTDSRISERRKNEYALKSIQLDRVSHTFVEELKNEIEVSTKFGKESVDANHEIEH